MNFNLDVRLKQLESLEQYISSSRDKVQSILECLKWDVKDILKESQLINCTIDPKHNVPSKSMNKHLTNCLLRKEGYQLDEEFLSEPLRDLNSSIVIDDSKKIEILSSTHRNIPDFKSGWNRQDPDPKTTDRLVCTFSVDERMALYSYAVTNTVGPPEVPEFNIIQPVKSGDKPLTIEELRIRERDAKRRRIKHKSVHTNRKSYKEVLKEVIDGQMELYMDWLVDNGLAQTKLEQNSEHSSKNEPSIKSDSKQSYDEHESNRHSSELDFGERSQSVVSKNSTHSSSSKSTRNHRKDKYEHSYHRHYDNHDYRRYHDKKRSGVHSRNSRRKSRERHKYLKRRRSHSKHGHENTSRYDDSKVR